MATIVCRYLVEGILSSRWATAGEILDLGHLDRMMVTCEAVLPLGAIVFGEDNG
jgi:hypothetical protein